MNSFTYGTAQARRLLSGLLAQRLLPGSLFRAQALSAFFGVPVWLAALTGAAILLLACRTRTGRSAEPRPKEKGVLVAVSVRRCDA